MDSFAKFLKKLIQILTFIVLVLQTISLIEEGMYKIKLDKMIKKWIKFFK